MNADVLAVPRQKPLQCIDDPQAQIVADDQEDGHHDDRDQHDDQRQLDQAGAGTLILVDRVKKISSA